MFASSAMEKVALEWVHRLGRYRYAIRCWSNQKKLDARQREQSSYGCRQKSYCAGQKAEHVHASLYVMLSHAARKWCGERRGTKFSSNCTFSFDWIRELQGEKLQKFVIAWWTQKCNWECAYGRGWCVLLDERGPRITRAGILPRCPTPLRARREDDRLCGWVNYSPSGKVR